MSLFQSKLLLIFALIRLYVVYLHVALLALVRPLLLDLRDLSQTPYWQERHPPTFHTPKRPAWTRPWLRARIQKGNDLSVVGGFKLPVSCLSHQRSLDFSRYDLLTLITNHFFPFFFFLCFFLFLVSTEVINKKSVSLHVVTVTQPCYLLNMVISTHYFSQCHQHIGDVCSRYLKWAQSAAVRRFFLLSGSDLHPLNTCLESQQRQIVWRQYG